MKAFLARIPAPVRYLLAVILGAVGQAYGIPPAVIDFIRALLLGG